MIGVVGYDLSCGLCLELWAMTGVVGYRVVGYDAAFLKRVLTAP